MRGVCGLREGGCGQGGVGVEGLRGLLWVKGCQGVWGVVEEGWLRREG